MALTCSTDVQNVQLRVLGCQSLLRSFHWLADSFVLDFFTENHWQKLPQSWAKALEMLTSKQLGEWILSADGKCSANFVLPLSLLAFGAACKSLALDRTAIPDSTSIQEYLMKTLNKTNVEEATIPTTLHALHNVFRKHVKPKKQHELEKMSSCCATVSKATNCQTVVDVGAGVGHLSRYLSFGYGLELVCVEGEGGLGTSASKLDTQLLEAHSKLGYSNLSVPRHITQRILPSTNLSHVLSAHLKEEKQIVSLIGLHTCGDLGPTMIRNFAQNDSVKFIVAVGCCYMKMNIQENETLPSYPMSNFVRKHLNPSYINYEGLEVACHSLDSYCDRLIESDIEKLKVHCYRATLETILTRQNPSIRRAGLRGVKNAHLMPFKDYAMKAVEKLDIKFDPEELTSDKVKLCLNQWKNVVSFYTLRVLLAPIIETIVQLDRLIFLSEQGLNGCLVPLFDSRLSPRNYALLCVKPGAAKH